MRQPANGKRVAIAGIGLIALLLVACSELLSWVLIYEVPRTAKLFYAPAKIAAKTYERYLSIRDPLLGWPAETKVGTSAHDGTGARPSPSFPGPGPGCLSAYGDSFTYGEEVAHEDAWPELLALKLGCRVANFGVGGYGTGQALLRYQEQPWDDSPTVILGIYQENILRIVNQYRRFLSGGDPLGFKPRFVLADGKLTLVPIPVGEGTDLTNALQPPFAAFKHEHFLPGSDDGQVIIRFPYTFSVVQALMTTRVQNGLRDIPNWLEFYEKDHPSDAFPLMMRIVEQFAADTARRGQDFRVVIFPSTVSYLYRFESGEDPTQVLSDALDEMGIAYLDLAKEMHDRIGAADYCELLSQQWRNCGGHYNSEGNAMVADIVFEWLSQEGAG